MDCLYNESIFLQPSDVPLIFFPVRFCIVRHLLIVIIERYNAHSNHKRLHNVERRGDATRSNLKCGIVRHAITH